MKQRLFLNVAAALASAAALPAQVVDMVIVNRQLTFTQTTAGSAAPRGSTPYGFGIFIDGQALDTGGFTFTFKKPGDAVTVYASEPDYAGSGATSLEAPLGGLRDFSGTAALQAAFPAGAYTISTGTFADVSLTIPDLFGTTNDGFANTPFVIGTQNGNPVTWVGGKMIVDPTKELTITSTAFTTNNGSGTNRIGLLLTGPGVDLESTNESPPNSFTFAGTSLQLQVAANTLTPGSTYSGNLEFNNLASLIVDLSGSFGGNADGISVYTAMTEYTVQAIPEPAESAQAFGALALAAFALRRRQARAVLPPVSPSARD